MNPELLDKTPPHDLNVELQVVGSLILDPSKMTDVAAVVRGEDFYAESTGLLFHHLKFMADAGHAIDVTLLVARLKEAGDFDKIGGSAFIAEALRASPVADHAVHYAGIVADHARSREMIHAGLEMVRNGYDPTAPKPSDMAGPDLRRTTFSEAARDYLESVTERGNQLLETGLPDVDYAIGGGIERGEVVILGARPGHGKSLVALQFIHQQTLAGTPCLMISEEMSARAIGKRVIQFASDKPEEHWHGLPGEVAAHLDDHFESRAVCHLVESCGTAERACDEIRKAVEKHDIEFVAVDYATMLKGEGRSRYEAATDVSIKLKQVANECGITLLLLCQLNREIEKRPKFEPKLSDLKDTGQFEQDADVVLFLLWPHKIDPNRKAREYIVFVGKNRNRATNSNAVTCDFEPSRQMLQPDGDTLRRYAPQTESKYPEFDF